MRVRFSRKSLDETWKYWHTHSNSETAENPFWILSIFFAAVSLLSAAAEKSKKNSTPTSITSTSIHITDCYRNLFYSNICDSHTNYTKSLPSSLSLSHSNKVNAHKSTITIIMMTTTATAATIKRNNKQATWQHHAINKLCMLVTQNIKSTRMKLCWCNAFDDI